MPSFVKFILVMILVAMCGYLGVVVYTEHHIKTWQLKNATRERAEVEALFARIDKKFRRADMVVSSQTMGGDKKILSTTVILQPWGIDKNGSSSIPLTPQVITIDGGAPVIVIQSLKFADGFRFDDDDDIDNYSGIVAGRTIYLFDHVQSASEEGAEKPNANRAEVPVICQVNPLARPNGFENGLWHKIWLLAKSPTAARGGLHEETFESLPTAVRPGVVYQVWIEGADRPRVREQEDPDEVAAMLNAANLPQAQPGE